MSVTAGGDDLHQPRAVLVVGGGAREHALSWRLRQDPGVERVLVAPGNAGHADVAEVHEDVAAHDHPAIVALAVREAVDLVVVGPEAPLVAGLADRLRAAGIPTFGPCAAAAAVEGSKALGRRIATRAGVPMAPGAVFDAVTPALAYAAALGGPVVVKADGLAAGKGVTVCATLDEAEVALQDALERRVFGDAGRRVVVERALSGREASVIAICDTTTALALPAARDHKRIGEGDVGPNTGGMGAYSPVPDLDDAAVSRIVADYHLPTLAALAARGRPFRGALYAGLMLTAEGPAAARVQRPVRGPGGAGDPAARRGAARHAAARGRHGPAGRGGRGARDRGAAAAGAAGLGGGRGARRGGLPGDPGHGRRDRGPRRGPRRRGARVRGRDGSPRGSRGHGGRPGAHRRGPGQRPRRPPHRRPTGRRARCGSAGARCAGTSDGRASSTPVRAGAGGRGGRGGRGRQRSARDDPALHAARDGRALDGPGALRGDAARRARRRPCAGRAGPGAARGRRDASPRGPAWTSTASPSSSAPPTTT